jgi:hypothetical protein
MHDVHVKLCPGFPRQKRHLRKDDHCHHHIGLKLRKKPVKFYIWNTAFFWCLNLDTSESGSGIPAEV